MEDESIFSNHAKEMMTERNILREFVIRTIKECDRISVGEDGNTHYFKSIIENEGRVLHVVVNQNVNPNKIVTLFYDRKAGRKI